MGSCENGKVGPSRTPPYSFAINLGDMELLELLRGLRICELLADFTADPIPPQFSPGVSPKVVAYASQKKKKIKKWKRSRAVRII